ncbi:SPOR domain-containing protein [Longitalea arenae]|uniref:SPOR domain-containing protein n=1 Tax=Longitalea arenae TaxID=2812558 RepID=UPI00196709AA|nr:SPOR domain-containing protein [Longitalea arenae]
MKYIISCVLLILSHSLFAQTQTDSNGIVVHKDPRIDMLIKKQIEINEFTTRDARSRVQGFRILVLNTNDRNKANSAKAKIYQEFPELKAYLEWKSPYMKVKVGDFKTRNEAEPYLSAIQRFFPNGVYIIRDIIEVNPDKSGTL